MVSAMDHPGLADDFVAIIDPKTGYALNLSVVWQGPPFWWERLPDIYSRIRSERARLGIEIDDFPDGPPIRREVEDLGNIVDVRAALAEQAKNQPGKQE